MSEESPNSLLGALAGLTVNVQNLLEQNRQLRERLDDDRREMHARSDQLQRDCARQLDEIRARFNGTGSELGLVREVDNLKRQMKLALGAIKRTAERRARSIEKRRERATHVKTEATRARLMLAGTVVALVIGLLNFVRSFW